MIEIQWRDVLTVFGFIVGIVGFIFTIKGNIKARQLGAKDEQLKQKDAQLQTKDQQVTETLETIKKERNTVRWREIHGAARELSVKLQNKQFIPDFILALSPRGAIIAFCLTEHLGKDDIPIISGVTQWTDSNAKDKAEDNQTLLSNYKNFKKDYVECSNKIGDCTFYYPKTIYNIEGIKDKHILIIEDVALSGSSLNLTREKFVSAGFSVDKIKTMTLATSRAAANAQNAPDFFWWVTSADEMYLPWGQAWGEGISKYNS